MICYRCNKISYCSIFQKLYSMSKDFCINDCGDYDEASAFKYKKIADHDDLMHVLYDYFTDQLDKEALRADYSDEEIKEMIKKAMWNL